MIAFGAVAAMLARVAFATRRGFWLDEYYTLQAVRLPWREMFIERLTAGHSPVPFVYARLFHDWVGTGELALRLSSILACGVAVAGTAALLVALGARRALLPLLSLLILHPYWANIGTEFRYTMLIVAGAAWWMWALVLWLRMGGWRWGAAAGLIGGATLSISASGQLLWIALMAGVAAWSWGDGWRRLGARLTPLWAALLIAQPIFVAISLHTTFSAKKQPDTPSIGAAISNQVESLFGAEERVAPLIGSGNLFQAAAYIIWVSGLALAAWWCIQRGDRRTVRLVAAMLVGLSLAAMIFSAVSSNIQGPVRYVAAASVPLSVAMALAWVAAGSLGRWGIAWRVLAVLVVGLGFIGAALDKDPLHRETIHWIRDNRRANDPVYTMGRAMNLLALDYHGVRGGRIDGYGTPDDDSEAAAQWFTEQVATAPSEMGFLLLYHGGRFPIRRLMDPLVEAGLVLEWREWQPSHRVRVAVWAGTPAGVARMQSLHAPPSSRFATLP